MLERKDNHQVFLTEKITKDTFGKLTYTGEFTFYYRYHQFLKVN